MKSQEGENIRPHRAAKTGKKNMLLLVMGVPLLFEEKWESAL